MQLKTTKKARGGSAKYKRATPVVWTEERCKQFDELRAGGKLSYAEMAKIMGLTKGQVWGRVAREHTQAMKESKESTGRTVEKSPPQKAIDDLGATGENGIYYLDGKIIPIGKLMRLYWQKTGETDKIGRVYR